MHNNNKSMGISGVTGKGMSWYTKQSLVQAAVRNPLVVTDLKVENVRKPRDYKNRKR